MIGLKGAVEQQNMRYGGKKKKITHFGEQAGRQDGRFGGVLNGRGEISGEQGMGCARER